jgi:hypothetical protein
VKGLDVDVPSSLAVFLAMEWSGVPLSPSMSEFLLTVTIPNPYDIPVLCLQEDIVY